METILVSGTNENTGEQVLIRINVKEDQIVQSLWPKDLTICSKCKRDFTQGRHGIAWGTSNDLVCLR